MKAKQEDKLVLDERIEKGMDKEFQKLKITPRIFHFREGVKPFKAVTIVGDGTFTYNYARRALNNSLWHHYCLNPATELLNALRRQGIWGVAVCDPRDQFSRQEGRRRAKYRLLRHLKGRE